MINQSSETIVPRDRKNSIFTMENNLKYLKKIKYELFLSPKIFLLAYNVTKLETQMGPSTCSNQQ